MMMCETRNDEKNFSFLFWWKIILDSCSVLFCFVFISIILGCQSILFPLTFTVLLSKSVSSFFLLDIFQFNFIYFSAQLIRDLLEQNRRSTKCFCEKCPSGEAGIKVAVALARNIDDTQYG